MLLMLADVTGWLYEQNIPYFITYGTLLGACCCQLISPSHHARILIFDLLPPGAVREKDILPWTQASTCVLRV